MKEEILALSLTIVLTILTVFYCLEQSHLNMVCASTHKDTM